MRNKSQWMHAALSEAAFRLQTYLFRTGESASYVLSLTMISYARGELKKRILRDKYCRLVFSKRSQWEIYVVGGFVRDVLRGVRTSDRDFVVGGGLPAFVREIRSLIGGTVVQFKADGLTRIVTEGQTLDFTRLTGTITEDLSQRDFSINAMAWSCGTGLIDTHNGIEDMHRRIIRALAFDNMKADPLRMVRAYRFAAELNASIEHGTRAMVRTLKEKIREVSTERITLEFFNLLNSEHAFRYLEMALEDGLLGEIFPLSYEILEDNIIEMNKYEEGTLKQVNKKIKVLLKDIYSQNLTRKGLLCLASLFEGCGDSCSKALRLRISNRILRQIHFILAGLGEWKKQMPLTPAGLFDVFMKAESATSDLIMMLGKYELSTEYARFKRIWKAGLLSSREIIALAPVSTGPEKGEMLRKVKSAEFERKIRSRKQATDYIHQLQPMSE